jgi:hypothetical protein
MTVALVLMAAVALTAAVVLPRVLTRAGWPDREPVLGLWVWQCLVATVLVCCLAALLLGATAAFGVTVGATVLAVALMSTQQRRLRAASGGEQPAPPTSTEPRLATTVGGTR